MGLLIGGAVFPTAFAVIWRKQSKTAAISGCIFGLGAGLTAWLVTAKQYYSAITVETTGLLYPTLAGNLASIMTGLIVSVTISLIRPNDFDWELTRSINAITTDGVLPVEPSTPELRDSNEKKGEHDHADPPQQGTAAQNLPEHLAPTIQEDDDPRTLRRPFRFACIAAFVLTFILDFLLPMPMFFSEYVFSKGFFTAWVVISFIWVFASSAISCLLPIWETKDSIRALARKITDKSKH